MMAEDLKAAGSCFISRFYRHKPVLTLWTLPASSTYQLEFGYFLTDPLGVLYVREPPSSPPSDQGCMNPPWLQRTELYLLYVLRVQMCSHLCPSGDADTCHRVASS